MYVFHQSLWHISTHAPAQGATLRRQKPPLGEAYFNPRSRTGSDIWTIVTTTLFQIFQPTLPHRERRIPPPQKSRCGDISTHAPAQGADVNLRRYMAGEPEISTHAPAQGATAFNHIFEQSKPPFQPTLPHRERRTNIEVKYKVDIISTHAPAQGATLSVENLERGKVLFQPTLPAQGATYLRMTSQKDWRFQPTLPHRERLIDHYFFRENRANFNPRSRTGERPDKGMGCYISKENFNPRSRTGSDD